MNTVIDFIEPYLNRCQNEKRLSKDTVKAYRLDLYQYRDYLYEMKMKSLKPGQVTKRMIQEYIMYLNEKFAAKTVKRKSIPYFSKKPTVFRVFFPQDAEVPQS